MSTHIAEKTQVQESTLLIPGYRIVKAGLGKLVALCGAGELPYGVAQIKTNQLNPLKVGQPFEVAVFGGGYVECGGNIAKGAFIASDANGKAVAAVEGDYIVGIADEAGADGDIIGFRMFISKFPETVA